MASHFHSPTTSITATTGSGLSSDVASMTTTLSALDLSAQSVSTALNSAFSSASSSAKSFDQVLTSLVSKMAAVALKPVAKQAGNSLQSFFSQAFSGLSAPTSTQSADSSFSPFTLYADGGIVSSPTFFGSGSGLGVMGERGAEAIMPLARGPDGTLGLATSRQTGGANVVVNISTPDAESFRRSDQQLSSTLARAVNRGQRSL